MQKSGNDIHVTIDNIGGKVIKDTEKYELTDNSHLNNLVLSKTRLRAKQSTNGQLVYKFFGAKVLCLIMRYFKIFINS